MSATIPLLKKLLLKDASHSRLRAAWIALCAGLTLLLISLMIWWNFQQILNGKKSNDSLGSTFLTINKEVTNENAADSHAFTDAEVDALKKAPQVQDAAALIPASFPAYISMGGKLGFSTLLPLEAAPERFMDKMPKDWKWEEGSLEVPIIIPNEFLNQYNFVFAPSQGLPRLSETTIKSIGFNLVLGAEPNQVRFVGHVAGFSDRITSILAPESFVKTFNQRIGQEKASAPSRVIIKAKDPSDPAFSAFLKTNHYITNAEQLRWNQLRAVVQSISIATGVLAILLIGISALVFVLFIELTLAKAKDAIQLLLQIGYGPGYLQKFMSSRFLPIMLSAVLVSLMIGAGVQVLFYYWVQTLQIEIGILPGWPIWFVAGISCLLLIWQMRRTIGKALHAI